MYHERKVWGVANYVIEGIEGDLDEIFDKARDDMVETIEKFCTAGRPYAHLAIKLTGLACMEMFETWSKAHEELIIGMFRTYASRTDENGFQIATKAELK